MFSRSFYENLSDYPESTTIHGIKYVAARSRPLADRIFWFTIFIVSSSFFGYFVYKISRTWMENPVELIDGTTPTQVYEIPFPAVTICPQLKVKADKFNLTNFAEDEKQFSSHLEFMNSDFGKKYMMATQICHEEFKTYVKPKLHEDSTYSKFFPNDWINILRDISPNFHEVFKTCEQTSILVGGNWETPSKKNCERSFSSIITNEGMCFTFNGIHDILRTESLYKDFPYHNITQNRNGWDPENGYSKLHAYPQKGIVSGNLDSVPGLRFVLTANLSNDILFCFPQSIGYKIKLHSPAAYPQFYDNFIQLAYGKEYKIQVLPGTIKANDDLRSFSPKERNCYFNDERQLKFYTFYNEENCRLECFANYSVKMFGGVPFSSPRDLNTTNMNIPYKNFGWGLPTFAEQFQKYAKVFGLRVSLTHLDDIFNCNCLPECNAIQYDYKIMNSNDEFSIVSKDLPNNVVVAGPIIQTALEIMYIEPSFIGKKRVRRLTFETMISDFGGLLGLFMGGSIISLFELIYFLTIRNYATTEVRDKRICKCNTDS